MKRILLAAALLAMALGASAQDRDLWKHLVDYTPSEAEALAARKSLPHRYWNNISEEDVPEYTLPELLVSSSGKKIRNKRQWEKVRRPEILEIFSSEMYGHVPERPQGQHFAVASVDTLFGGKGLRKKVDVWLDEGTEHGFQMVLVTPADAKGPVPMFMGLNFTSNDSTFAGTKLYAWQYEQALDAGFGIATAWYEDISPDFRGRKSGGVREWFPGRDWGSISAWAWGLSRMLDYLETDPDADATKVAVLGHSRLGKTALWAGANDQRFALVISNASGSCGADLSRRRYGETFEAIQRFQHWFCEKFYEYKQEDDFPLDQHCLLALTAPRPIYVASSNLDFWCDPKGEWMSAVAAQPAWKLYREKGLSHPDRMPEVGERDDAGFVAYRYGFGAHAILPSNWAAYIQYAARYFGVTLPEKDIPADRAYWVESMDKIVRPVFENLSQGTLRKNMPVETWDGLNNGNSRKDVTHLEALGRAFDGIAPWLELGPDDSQEGQLRGKYIDMVVASIAQAVNPESPDYLPFDGPEKQPLVDAAFFAQGLLRSKHAVWRRLDSLTKERVIKEFKASRKITPHQNNWLLFSAMIEAALLEFTGEYDPAMVNQAFNKMDDWYVGDGWYADGPVFHLDYYNSYVMQPMILEIAEVMKRHGKPWGEYYEKELPCLVRYAEQQERMISPEGAYPVLGRSMGYRFGCFQNLSEAALLGILPKTVTPAGVRSALTAVIQRQLVPETFDENGWLTLGFCGHQPTIADTYVSTGSAYLCSFIFLPLGLTADDPFWTAPAEPWSSQNAWGGRPVHADHAIK